MVVHGRGRKSTCVYVACLQRLADGLALARNERKSIPGEVGTREDDADFLDLSRGDHANMRRGIAGSEKDEEHHAGEKSARNEHVGN